LTTTKKKTVPNLADRPRAMRAPEAYRLMKHEIMQNTLPPGFQCMETELAERYGISRTPIREALVKLAQEGLIELRRRRGMRVLPISPAEMRDIYDLLTILEPECASALARDGLTAEQLDEIVKAVSDMEAAIGADDLAAWAAADDRFHRLHLKFARNRRLARMICSLLDQAHRVRMFTLKFRERPFKSTAEHAEMVRLLSLGDAERVRQVYREHREIAAKELMEILERYQFEAV
jgi:DNA-binding GntR family transcriptional regulator